MAGFDKYTLYSRIEAALAAEDSGIAPVDPKALRQALQKAEDLDEYVDTLLAEYEDARELVGATENFARNGLLTLLKLVGAPPDGTGSVLKELREQLLSKAELDEMQVTLLALKDSVSKAPSTTGGLVSKPLLSPEEDEAPSAQPLDTLDKLRQIYMSLLNAIQLDLDDEYSRRAQRVLQEVMTCSDIDLLIALEPEIESVIRQFSQEVLDRRRKAHLFASEILNHLAGLNTYLKESYSCTKEQGQADQAFAGVLDGQLETLNSSVQDTDDLTSLKALVVEGLQAVKTTIEEKREEDRKRTEETQQKMTDMRKDFGRLAKRVATVQKKNEELVRMVQIDPLTEISNRYAFIRRLQAEFLRVKDARARVCLVIADIDFFKRINDTYGHLVGDKCLKEIAHRLTEELRERDFLARYGGEEFVAILRDAGKDEAMEIAERMRQRIERTEFTFRKQEVTITVSCGVSEIRADDPDSGAPLDRADKALYEAKSSGRNQVKWR